MPNNNLDEVKDNNQVAEQEYKPTFVDKFFDMHARVCERHSDKGGIYNLVRWLVKQQEIIVYLVVGVLTTIVSLGCKFLFNIIVYHNAAVHSTLETTILAAVNWTTGVAFAYPVSRVFVFKSHGKVLPEVGKFVLSRLTTLGADWLIMFVLDTVLGINVYIATAVSMVVVTVANYIFSKILVFSKKKK